MTRGSPSSHPSPPAGEKVTEGRMTGCPPLGVTLWLLVSAYLSAAGWVLSALQQLNPRGYVCALMLGAVALVVFGADVISADWKRFHLHRWVRRFKRPLPFGFLVLTVLSLLGALLYLPVNYDALAYRVPRVLHWLAHRQWHWVHSSFPRLNVRATGYEWIMAPLIALTKTTRWLFLPSMISFLLLPGLFFSVMTQFGVKRRVAWNWMWILTTGFCYVSQAGSIGNDLFGGVYALAAFDFGLRLRRSKSSRDLWLFVIATGLLTGAKASNFPLLLPLFLLFIPNWRLLLVKPLQNILVIIFAAAASFLPTAIFNLKYGGDWTGMNLEGPMKKTLDQFGINITNWLIQNLSPPVFPFTSQWSHLLLKIHGLSAEAFRCFGISELTGEEEAGTGLGISLLLIFGVLATLLLRRRAAAKPARPTSAYWKLIIWSPYISLLVFAAKAQVQHSASRIISPYYAVLIIPFLLYGFHEHVLRSRWWKALVFFAFAMSIGVIAGTPGRPLWPALTIVNHLAETHPKSSLIARVQSVYWLYRERPHSFAPLAQVLPPDVPVFGMLTFDDPETSLWWPLGSRRIEHITPADTREDILARGIEYLIVPEKSGALMTSADDLIRKYDAHIVTKVPLFLRTFPGQMDWYVLKLGPYNPPVPDIRK
jgi:hypothetical protein